MRIEASLKSHLASLEKKTTYEHENCGFLLRVSVSTIPHGVSFKWLQNAPPCVLMKIDLLNLCWQKMSDMRHYTYQILCCNCLDMGQRSQGIEHHSRLFLVASLVNLNKISSLCIL